ncbi:MAG: hypothetical protein Q9188_005304 [Gyalolechia gomerana]
MPVSTRHKSALRRAEGHPPSPQNQGDLPRELRENSRRQRRVPRSKPSNRSTVTPDSEEDGRPKQDQVAAAQALREGNAGGYVVHNTSEQQSLLSEPQNSSSASQPKEAIGTHERRSSGEGTMAADIPPASTPGEAVHTPPHSPVFPNLSTPEILSTFNITSDSRLAQKGPRNEQPLEEQAARAKSVSTQTDGQFAPTALPTITRTSPITIRPPMRTASVQTDAPAERFRPLGLYDFRSELVDPPESCSITLHLSAEREIRISKVSSAAIHEIKNILHNRQFTYERNWLTSEEAAAVSATAAAVAKAEAEAAEKQHQSSNKRKRDDETDTSHNAQRRRIDSTATPTPMSTSTSKALRLRSRFRFKGRSSSQFQAATSSPRPLPSPTNPSKPAPSTVNYGRDGSLQLLGEARNIRPQNGFRNGNSVNQLATTTNDSDDEGESEGILLFPNLASANRAMFGDLPDLGPDTSAQTSVNAHEPLNNSTHATPPRPTDQPLDGEPTTSQVETPRTSNWGLGMLFNTARRFIPSIRGQRAPFAAPQTNRPVVRTQNTLDRPDATSSQRDAQTEPRRQDQRADGGATESTSNFAQRLRDSHSATQKTFRTKENIEEIKKLKAEKEKLKAEWRRLEEERKITEQERQDVEDAHRAAYAGQQPGSKRPLRISPRVIPNPKGVSYGLDPAYFDSSDEEEESSPSRFHPRKARRIHGPDRSQDKEDSGLNDQNAPFAGGLPDSSSSEALHYRGSHFSDSPPNVFSVSTASPDNRGHASKDASSTGLRINDPGFNRMGHFSVPLSPSSSEEDETEEAYLETPTREPSVSPLSEKDKSGSQISDDAAATASTSKTDALPSQPPVTPGPQQGAREVRFGKLNDPGKTLEQSRRELRAKLVGKGGKSVLSPKDIAASPLKLKSSSRTSKTPMADSSVPGSTSSVEQKRSSKRRSSKDKSPISPSGKDTKSQTPVSSGVKSDSQPSTKSGEEEGFSIRGAASRGVKRSPQRLPAETLPSVHSNVSQLHAFKDFQSKMDPTVRDYLESSWQVPDDEASANTFQSALTAHRVAEQHEVQPQATSTAPETLSAEPSIDDLEDHEDDDASSTTPKTLNSEPSVDDLEDYEDDSASFHGDVKAPAAASEMSENTNRALNAAQPNTVGNQILDPAVAAFLNSQWTSKDEYYAIGEFMNHYTSHKESKDAAENPSLNVAA